MDAGNDRALNWPASKKRQGTKSRELTTPNESVSGRYVTTQLAGVCCQGRRHNAQGRNNVCTANTAKVVAHGTESPRPA